MTDVASLQAALRDAVGERRVGPFVVRLDDDTSTPFRNFAVPDDCIPTAAEVDNLIAFFATHDRTPRIEVVVPCAAAEALMSAEWDVVQRIPLMAHSEEAPAPPLPAGLRLDRPTADADLGAVAAMQNAAYGEPGVSDADVTRLRRLADHGADLVAIWDGDACVSAGQTAPPQRDHAEVYGVATAESHRRRGLASCVGAELTRAAIARGSTPFLQAEGPVEERMYARLGYVTLGELVDLRPREVVGP